MTSPVKQEINSTVSLYAMKVRDWGPPHIGFRVAQKKQLKKIREKSPPKAKKAKPV